MTEMTIPQIKGMIKFHKRVYLACKATNNPNALVARKMMIEMYLKLRRQRHEG